jgi:hypothetical protein
MRLEPSSGYRGMEGRGWKIAIAMKKRSSFAIRTGIGVFRRGNGNLHRHVVDGHRIYESGFPYASVLVDSCVGSRAHLVMVIC